MKISVVLSYYKQPEILEKSLYIWTNQTFNHDDYEILVMDGGHDLEGIKVWEQYKSKFKNLRYFTYDGRIEYKCPIHSWNVGFRQARGDILLVTMEDRLTTFDAVEAMYKPHLKHQNIFCTVLPYLTAGSFKNNLVDTIDWRSNPKLFWSIAKPTIIATKEKEENETVFYSIPKKTIIDIGGFDERWRDYGYWMLDLRRKFIDYGLKPFEVSWIINMHHHHERHGTMQAELYDQKTRINQWEKIKNNPIENNNWGSMEGSEEL